MSYKSGHSFNDIQTVTGTINLSSIYSTVLADASGGAVTLNLPAAATYAEITFTIKAIDVTNTVTVTPNGVETIDGLAGSIVLSTLNEVITLQSTGTRWVLLDTDTSPTYTASNGVSLSTADFQLGTTTQNDAGQAFTADRYINLDTFNLELESTNGDDLPTARFMSSGDVYFGTDVLTSTANRNMLVYDQSQSALQVGRAATAQVGSLGLYAFAQGNTSSATGQSSVALNRSTATALQSFSAGTSTASATRAVAFGNNNTGSGANSFIAGGQDSTVSGSQAFVGSGDTNVASGDQSAVLAGSTNNALSTYGFVTGEQNTANSYAASVFGTYASVATGQSLTTYVSTDEIFKIGIGTGTGARADGLVLFKNGDFILGQSNQAGFAFANGLYFNPVKGSLASGRFNSVDITGLGDRATNFGDRNTVTGYSSFAAGVTNTASGGYSTAIGANNVSSADGSISLGGGLEPTAFSSVYAGMNATIAAGQTAGSFVSTDEIFKIGIGASTAARADGLIMTKDGKLRLPTYGVNTNTGTAAYSLQVDASGNVIEGSISTESTTADNGVSLSGTAVQLGHAASGTGASDFTANRYLYTNTFDLEVGNAVDANNFYIDASNGKIGIGVVPTGSADFGKLTINKQTGDAFPNLTLYEGAVYLKGDVDSSTAKTSLTSNGGITLNAGAAGGSSIVLESSQTAANSIYFTTKDGTYDIETSASFLNTIEYSHTPTTGAFEHSSLYIIPTINQTGTAAGIVSGVKLKPVLTALGGTYRGIDLAFNNANAYGVYQTGALTSNYYEGVNIFNGYGLGVREAADLSKTDSGYLAGFATDGTIIEVTPTTATSSFYNTGTTTFNEDTTTAAFRTGQTAFGADTFNGTRAVTITGFSSINDGNNSTYITGGNTNATGSSNIAIGYRSAESNLTGISNTYIGVESGLSNTSSFNTVLGASAYDGTSNTGNTNTVIGYRALRAPNFSGTNNIVIGATTVGAATTATSNVVVGNSSGSSLTSGNLNTLLGSNTGTALTTGANNTIVGRQSGQNITTGTDNIVIGSNVDGISATGNYELNIGNGIFGTGFDNAGSGANSGSLVGIRNSAPTAALHVTGVGATSATTALLVENSAGTDALTVDDVGTIEFNIYGLGNKEAADLTKTSSGYIAEFATDGTILETTLSSVPLTIETITAATSALTKDNTLLDATSNAVDLQPDPTALTVGQRYIVKAINTTNAVTITPTSGTIDGSASYTLPAQYDGVILFTDGTNIYLA